MSQGLDGRVVNVTGAGGGLGRSHALLLAARGASVVVNDLGGSPDGTGEAAGPAQAVVDEIVAAGGKAVANRDSVATQEGAAAIVQTAVDTFGRLDGVVNNAGILRDRTLAKLTAQDVDLVIDVHLKGTIFVSQAAFPVMKAAGFGRFVHTTSAAGLFGNFGQANYSAAKMGICGFSRTLAEEGARAGITSNVIAPLARTRLTEDLLGSLADALDPESVSPLVVALLDPACTVNREVISVGGGRFARVFTGLAPGWFAGAGAVPTVEDVTEHFDDILAVGDFTIPERATDEIGELVKVLGAVSTDGMTLGAR
jgi:NAD(P)-dependent dehydrogenase (short-subunit alcohol dehydrogenase family)